MFYISHSDNNTPKSLTYKTAYPLQRLWTIYEQRTKNSNRAIVFEMTEITNRNAIQPYLAEWKIKKEYRCL